MIQKRSQKEIRSVHSLSNFQLLRRRLLVSRGDEPPSERSIRNRKAVTWHVAGAGEEGGRLWPVNDFTAFSNFLSLTGMSKTGNTYSLFRLPSSFFSSDRCNNWIGFQNLFWNLWIEMSSRISWTSLQLYRIKVSCYNFQRTLNVLWVWFLWVHQLIKVINCAHSFIIANHKIHCFAPL